MEGSADDIRDYRESGYPSRPGSDLKTPFGIDSFNRNLATFSGITENLGDCDLVRDSFPSIERFDMGDQFFIDNAFH